MPKRRFRVGDHKKVAIIKKKTTTISGGHNGSGAFGCRMQRMEVTRETYRCVSEGCGAEAPSEERLRVLPHKPKPAMAV